MKPSSSKEEMFQDQGFLFGGFEAKSYTHKRVKNAWRFDWEIWFFRMNYLKYTEYLNNTHTHTHHLPELFHEKDLVLGTSFFNLQFASKQRTEAQLKVMQKIRETEDMDSCLVNELRQSL